MTDHNPPVQTAEAPAPPTGPRRPSGWTAGRVVATVLGTVLLVTALGTGAGATVLGWADQTQRTDDGFLSTDTDRLSTDANALRFQTVELEWGRGMPDTIADWVGEAQIRVTGGSDTPVFVGIGPEGDVDRYLAGVAHDEVTDLDDARGDRYTRLDGTGTPAAPADEQFWVASASGTSEQVITWEPQSGRWSMVVLNADGSRPVVADISAGLRAPGLTGLWIALLAGTGVLLVAGALLIFLGARHTTTRRS